jgi:MFS family permease
METWPNTSRPLLAGLLGGAANVGFLAAAGITSLLARWNLSWRYALVVGFFPALLTLAIRLFVRESERWVKSKERGERSNTAELFSPALRRKTLMGVTLAAVAVLGMWGVFQAWLQAWVEQLVGGGPELQAARASARATVSLWMAIGSTCGALLGGPAAEWLGRRCSYSLYCIGAVGMSWLLYLTCVSYGPRLLVLASVAGVFATAFFGWLPLYLPELFPTRIRATGEGLTFNAGRILSAVGVLVTGTLVQALGGYVYAASTMALVWVVGLMVIWFAPETKGCELPE